MILRLAPGFSKSNKRLRIAALALAACSLPGCARATEKSAAVRCEQGRLVVSGTDFSAPPDRCLFLFTDPGNALTFEEVAARDAAFVPATVQVPNFGYSGRSHWARVRVQNDRSARELLLEFAYPVVDHIEAFIEQPGRSGPNAGFERRVSGDAYPFSQRDLAYRHVVFKIPFAAGESKFIYLLARSSTSVQIPLILHDWDGFSSQDRTQQSILALYYGMILIMALYNFWLYVGLRDPSYLLYIGHVLGVGWSLMMQYGLAYAYLWPEATDWNNRAHATSVYLTGTFAVFFGRQFLNLKKIAPRLDFFFAMTGLGVGCVGLFGFALPYRTYALATAPLVLLFVLLSVFVGGVALVRGYRPARFYLLAWSFLFVGSVLLAMRNAGLLPHTLLTSSGLLLGSALDVALLSLALADRLHHMKRETERLNANLENLVAERTQELRDAYRELQIQDNTRTAFFTNVAHEIRTPLTLLLSPIESMSTATPEELGDQRRAELLSIMRRNGHSLLRLVNNLLDVSRIEADRLQYNDGPVDFSAMIREVTSNFQEEARRRRIALTVDVPDEPPPTARLDREKIEKALFNLIGNALKFTPQGSVRISLDYDGATYTIRVRDTGVGIPADQQAHVFERFRQAEGGAGRRLQNSGTGIGLFIVRRFAEMHGGRIRLESKPGLGSTFALELPGTGGAGGAPSPPPSPPEAPQIAFESADTAIVPPVIFAAEDRAGSPSRESVLLVEDNEDLLDFLTDTFRGTYRVFAARDGGEALRIAQRNRPDLIVTDIMMPVLSGLELLQKIRQDDELRDTPVILLTAKASISDRLEGLQAKADDYVTKPFYVGELLSRARNLLYRKRLGELAVARENQRIHADFHDHLGARLTDLSMLTGRLEVRDEARETRDELRRNLNALIVSFRDCLSAREDLNRLRENFANGLHIILLRRYVNAGRQLHFSIANSARELLSESQDENARTTLYAACTELATNDIRYGTGPARWDIAAEHRTLLVSLLSASEYDETRAPGNGVRNLRARLAEIGGEFEQCLEQSEYRATLRVEL